MAPVSRRSNAAAHLAAALAFSAVGVTPAAAALPCANPAADPCLISSAATVPVGVYDIRPKSLSVANKTITVSGAGELRILANDITIQPGGRFVASGTDGNTTITLDAAGAISLQSQGTSKSRIDVSGNFGGGTINLHSVGDLSVIGTLIANATNSQGYGGSINVKSDTGNVTIGGDPSEGIKSLGNSQGGGGAIAIESTLGSVNVSTQLVAKGGDCGSCEVDLTAGTSIATTAQGVIDMGASGVGDGGFLSVAAGTDVTMAGNVLANGSSDDMDGGAGGDALISASGNVTIGGRVEVSGSGRDASLTGFSVDGDGGSVDISTNGSITITGPMFGISKGFGQGDEFSYDGGGNVTMAGEIDMSGDNFPGDITVLSDALITVSARLRSAAPIDANHPAALGGTVDVEGCQVIVTSNGQLVCTGPGGDPSGSNLLVASTGMTIAGALLATDTNELDWRTSPPLVTSSVTPAPTIVNHQNLPCCGVQCPTTTTTTTVVTTSSSTSAPLPTTTSSTNVVPTTTSSTGTIPPTTSSTAPLPTTTTTTTVASTTTTSTQVSTSSTSSSTSSSSTSSTAHSTTTASTTTTSSTRATTSSTVVTTSTAPAPTTSTTQSSDDCTATTTGIDAVRCRLTLLADALDTTQSSQLGGANLAHALRNNLAKATRFTTDPTTPKHLKKAATQLKKFAAKVGRGISKRRVDPMIGNDLTALATEARSQLLGLGAQ